MPGRLPLRKEQLLVCKLIRFHRCHTRCLPEGEGGCQICSKRRCRWGGGSDTRLPLRKGRPLGL